MIYGVLVNTLNYKLILILKSIFLFNNITLLSIITKKIRQK